MALLLSIAIAGFVWTTPARDVVLEKANESIAAAKRAIATQREPFTARIQSLGNAARDKTMELLRRELHRAVDDTVQ